MNYNEILTPQEIADFKALFKQKKATVDDLKLWTKAEMITIYNEIISILGCMNALDHKGIYYRESMMAILASIERYNSNAPAVFLALKQSGYIGVCGTGYTLEKPRQRLTDSETDRIAEIMIAMTNI